MMQYLSVFKGYSVRLFLLGVLSFACVGGVSANEEMKKRGTIKVGTNMLSLLVIGDVNGSFEYMFDKHFSVVSTMHYVESSDFVKAEGEGFRATAGLRSYGALYESQNAFLELKLGMSHYINGAGDNVTTRGAPLSLEFYGGLSYRFNEWVFFETKFGLIRFFQSGEVSPGAGVNVGGIF